ncbi:MAG: hypothetical protein PHG65_04275 [Kiritimatiellae bacterium]|nr:hypothetical protein [Kiritimatiellia bacterium]
MILLDAHTHLYECFDLAASLDAALRQLRQPDGGTNGLRACMLTERSECSFFQRLENGALPPPAGWSVSPRGISSLCLTSPAGEELWLLAGRQIKTSEKLEISALFFHEIIPDGTPIRVALHRVIESGGTPCLNWALGKWLFARGRLIEELIREHAAHLLLCDSSMRPIGWPEPHAFAAARQRHVPILAGTDPLPCPLDQTRIGSYAVAIQAPFDPTQPDESFRKALFTPPENIRHIGRRSSIPLVLKRQRAYHRSTAQPATPPAEKT